MNTIKERITNHEIVPGKLYRVLIKQDVKLFPINADTISYREFFISDVVYDGNEPLVLLEYITGDKKGNTAWVDASQFDKAEVLRFIDVTCKRSNNDNGRILDNDECILFS